MEVSSVQLLVMLLTIAGVSGAGIYSARQVHSAEGFSVGGRSAGVPLVAGSIAGTCVGGGATVGTAQMAATVGLSAWWFTIGAGAALIIMGIFYARPLRSTALETIPQFLAENYGKGAETFAGLVSSFGILFSSVASCLPGIFILAALLQVGALPATAALFAFVVLYAFFGGMKSTGIGGILKMVVIWVTLVLAGLSAAQTVLADPVAFDQLSAEGFFSLLHGGAGSALSNLLSMVVGMVCTQTYIQAIFSAATPRTAAVGAFTAALITLPIGLPCSLIGMYMHVVSPETPAILALPAFLLTHQGAVLGGIAMGGIILSLIGSVAGLSLGIGAMVSRDLIFRLWEVKNSYSQLRIMRLVVLLAIALALGIALLAEGTQVLFWSYLSMALRGGGIFLPLTIAVWRRKAVSPRCAVTSMVASTAIAILAAFLSAPIKPIFLGLLVSAAIIVVGFWQGRHRLYHGGGTSPRGGGPAEE